MEGSYSRHISIMRSKGGVWTPTAIGAGVESSVALVSDNFDSYANGSDLAAAANWVQVIGTFKVTKLVSDGIIHPYNESAHSCVRYDDGITVFSSNQYVQATFEVGALSYVGYTGVAVRCQSGAVTYYGLMYSKQAGTLNLFYSNAGSAVDIVTPVAKTYVTGNKIRLEVSGAGANTRLTAKEDTAGSWVEAHPTMTSANPAIYIDGGNPGVAGYHRPDYDTLAIDDWVAGDL